MLTFPAPDALNGDQLAAELGVSPLDVVLVGDEIVIYADIPEETARRVVAAHVPSAQPLPVPLEERFEAFVAAVEQAASLASIKAAAATARAGHTGRA